MGDAGARAKEKSGDDAPASAFAGRASFSLEDDELLLDDKQPSSLSRRLASGGEADSLLPRDQAQARHSTSDGVVFESAAALSAEARPTGGLREYLDEISR